MDRGIITSYEGGESQIDAYWCIACSFCGKEIRFCTVCRGELVPVKLNTKEGENVKKLQCTNCQRIVNMHYCSTCGHEFKESEIVANMEITGNGVCY